MLRWARLVPLVSVLATSSSAQDQDADFVEVNITQAPGGESYPWVVALTAADGEDRLEFRVTLEEAQDVFIQAQGREMPRPLSHDLLHHIVDAAGFSLLGAIIEPITEDRPPAAGLWVEGPQGQFTTRARAGDAVATALRVGAPIFLSEAPIGFPDPPAARLSEYEYLSCEARSADIPPAHPQPMVAMATPDQQQHWRFFLSTPLADSIWLAMPEPAPKRLRIHDTIAGILKLAGIPMKRLVIGDIVENAIIGTLVLDVGGEEVNIDCRPSDGICIALRAEAPIYLTGASAASLQPVEAGQMPVP
jgi:bifunctional DNase/RNase